MISDRISISQQRRSKKMDSPDPKKIRIRHMPNYARRPQFSKLEELTLSFSFESYETKFDARDLGASTSNCFLEASPIRSVKLLISFSSPVLDSRSCPQRSHANKKPDNKLLRSCCSGIRGAANQKHELLLPRGVLREQTEKLFSKRNYGR